LQASNRVVRNRFIFETIWTGVCRIPSRWNNWFKGESAILSIRRPSAIAVFFSHIFPPIPFFDYPLIFNGRLNNKSVLFSLLRRGLWFDSALLGTEKAELLAQLSHHQTAPPC
jgi:hypothetical protein